MSTSGATCKFLSGPLRLFYINGGL